MLNLATFFGEPGENATHDSAIRFRKTILLGEKFYRSTASMPVLTLVIRPMSWVALPSVFAPAQIEATGDAVRTLGSILWKLETRLIP
jgi:hypothetical protein